MAKLLSIINYKKGSPLSIFLKMNNGLLRMLRLAVIIVLIMHLAACLLCAIPGLEVEYKHSWIYRYTVYYKV